MGKDDARDYMKFAELLSNGRYRACENFLRNINTAAGDEIYDVLSSSAKTAIYGPNDDF